MNSPREGSTAVQKKKKKKKKHPQPAIKVAGGKLPFGQEDGGGK